MFINPVIALSIGLLLIAILTMFFWPNGGIIGYLQRSRQFSDRILREDALKHLHKSERHGSGTTFESLAGALHISTAHAVSLIQDMQSQELITLDGEYFKLTPKGHDYALQIIRAHRLWERYLAEETGYDQANWHDIAERYEHQLSPDQTNELSNQLGNPTHDPHGDPIPTADGELVLHGGQPLTEMEIDQPLQILHIEDEPETVYAQLVAEGLYPGMTLRLVECSSKRVRFWSNDGGEHLLAPIVAANISVAPVTQEVDETIYIGEPLYALPIGEEGRVVALSPRLRGAERRRMMDLGILPGTTISAELMSPGGQPTAYRIRGALIALRKEQAEHVRIMYPLEVTS